MSDQPRINELLEAYRPGIDDLADDAWEPLRAALADDGEMQRRAQTIQRHNQAVSTAMHDVAVPAGLAERLLASLPDGESTNVLSTAPPETSEPVSLPSAPAAAGRFARRAWAAAIIGTAAVVALAIGIWPKGPSDTGNVTADELARMVIAWENDESSAASGRDCSAQGLSSYPVDEKDVTAPAVRVVGPMSQDNLYRVVYDLSSSSGKKARLHVAYTGRAFGVPSAPSARLRGLTGPRNGIAWQRGDYLYVVVVDSQVAAPEEFVRIREFT